MWALRALKRWSPALAGLVALSFAAPAVAVATPSREGSIPKIGRSLPAVGGNVGDVITTTCGDSPVIVLSVIVCQLELPAPGA
jgi:hypothetical protein